MRTTCIVAAACLCLTVFLPVAANAKTSVLILPGSYADDKEALAQQIGDFAMRIGSKDQLIVYDGSDLNQLAVIARPTGPNAENRAWVKRQMLMRLAPVIRHIIDLPLSPTGDGPVAGVRVPAMLDEIGRNLVPSLPEQAADVLIVGSFLYHDPDNPGVSMLEGYFPSDGHLKVREGVSPYGIAGLGKRLAGVTVHWCGANGEAEFTSVEHESAVARFWTLWVTGQGGRVGTMSYVLPTCFARFQAGEASGQLAYAISRDTKVEMLRVRPPTAANPSIPGKIPTGGADFITRSDLPISHTPPSTSTGVGWVGIRWSAPVDLDLYTRGRPDMPFLFFGNVRTPEGRFDHDFRAATGVLQFEFVEYEEPINLNQAEVLVNLYEGNVSAPIDGVLRFYFDNKLYEAKFQITATQGNRGLTPITLPQWVRIDLRKVVGLPSSAAQAGQ